jgi:hypothetical protein
MNAHEYKLITIQAIKKSDEYKAIEAKMLKASEDRKFYVYLPEQISREAKLTLEHFGCKVQTGSVEITPQTYGTGTRISWY